MAKINKVGLALSGGGYRAAIYHIGTFKALKKMNLLDKIDVISTNSGGSITGACYSLNSNDFDKFEETLVSGVQKSVVAKIITHPRFFIPVTLIIGSIVTSIYLLFTTVAWINIIIWPILIFCILYAQYELLPISRIIESIYDKLFFKKATLKDLSKTVQTTINSTNLSTGRIFHFSAKRMGDSTYDFRDEKDAIYFDHKNFPVARAVMASSCVPFAFTPVKIDKIFFYNKNQYSEIKPRLVDGGVYDNQGIHKLTFYNNASYCKNVIISDAGNKLAVKENYRNMLTLLIRTSEVFMARIKNFQMMNNLYRVPLPTDSNVAYQSLGFDLSNSVKEFMEMLKKGYIATDVIEGHNIPQTWLINKNWDAIEELVSNKVNNLLSQGCSDNELKLARSVGTNLVPLSKTEAKALIKHAEISTEIQLKVFLPHVLNEYT